jgi:hypothetical protein
MAQAETTDQEILLAPAAESSMEAPEVSESANHRFSFGLGSGVNSFGGNMGKLYSTSSAAIDVRGDWAFHPQWVMRAGADSANYSFNAQPNGSVMADTKSLQLAMQFHFLSTALASGGFDPYATVGVSNVFRTQTFQERNAIEKDTALGSSAGVGASYMLPASQLGFWMEASAGQVYFQDRNSQEYFDSGLDDLNGLLYSARLGMKYYF